MYSIICCSVNPKDAGLIETNIADTIGMPFEFIAFDNRKYNDGLCKVYNACARKAKYELLCFVHGDVRFLTKNWGKLIEGQLRQPGCGVIGFAGSILKLKRLTGWNTCSKALRANYVQYMRGGDHARCVNPEKESFSPVVTLDGLCLLVRRDVWEETLFDEVTFQGFHCYDIDFSLSVARRYTNYVCHTVLVKHYSQGSFSRSWLQGLEVFHEKWRSCLPMYVGTLTEKDLARYDRLGEGYSIKFLWQKGCFDVCCFRDGLRYLCCYPFRLTAWMLFPKYLKYRLRYRHRPS